MYVTEATWCCDYIDFNFTVALLLYTCTAFFSVCRIEIDVPISPSADGHSSAKLLGVAFVQPHCLVAFHRVARDWESGNRCACAQFTRTLARRLYHLANDLTMSEHIRSLYSTGNFVIKSFTNSVFAESVNVNINNADGSGAAYRGQTKDMRSSQRPSRYSLNQIPHSISLGQLSTGAKSFVNSPMIWSTSRMPARPMSPIHHKSSARTSSISQCA
jgi:hypothetical protein